MEFPQLPVGAFLAAIIVLIPLPWHWRAKNIGTLAIIAWLFVINLIYGINSIVWAGNVNNPVPVWCDITTKIIIGASSALPIATMCVCKQLELVSSSRKVRLDNVDRRRRIIFDSVMCFGLPLVLMALHYIVQGHRFDILENIGCQPATYFSIPGVFIVWFPPLFFSFLTVIYATIALHHFIRRRISFAAHLQNSNSALTTNRYLRLIAMSITEIIWGTAFTAFNIWSNVSPGLRPWTNWADVHSNFSRVDLYPTIGFPHNLLTRVFLFWWAMPASAFIFFLFFGFGEEALKEYKKIATFVRKYILRQEIKDESSAYTKSFPSSRFNRPVLISTLPIITVSSEVDVTTISSPCAASSSSTLGPLSTKPDKLAPQLDIGARSSTSTLPHYYTDPIPSPSAYSSDETDSASLHAISISETFQASRPPTPEFGRAVGSRPFSPPSVCPISSAPRDVTSNAHPVPPNGSILVTIHRHRTDDIV